MLRVAYLVMSLMPTAAVVALAWFVVRAVSVRVVWRETGARPRRRARPERRGRRGGARAYTGRVSAPRPPRTPVSGPGCARGSSADGRGGPRAARLRAAAPRRRRDSRRAHRRDRGLPRPRRSRGPRLLGPHGAQRAPLGPGGHDLRLSRLRHAPLPEPGGRPPGLPGLRADPRRGAARRQRPRRPRLPRPRPAVPRARDRHRLSGRHLFETDATLTLREGAAARIAVSPRVGIRRAAERPLRFYDAASAAVSGPWPAGVSSALERPARRGRRREAAPRRRSR